MRRICAFVAGAALAMSAEARQPQAKPGRGGDAPGIAASVHERVESILKVLADGGEFGRAEGALRELFHQLVAYAPASESAAFAEADSALRMVEQLSGAGSPRPALTYLRKHPELARELAMTLGTGDDIPGAYAVLGSLIAQEPERAAQMPGLAAALCAVYDEPHTAMASRMDGHEPDVIEPVAVFRYYALQRGRMLFDPGTLPARVLVFLVDTQAAVPELAGALSAHAGDRNVGKRYFDLTYDTPAFKYNQPKKISKLPYTLENLRRVGGVCQEQAYYAAHVAKAIGVPATIISGRAADVGHAWVGFLQDRGGTLSWNMNEGHYDEYEKLRGSVRDPQTGRTISDDELALTADLCGVPAAQRHAALALAHAAGALLRDRGKDWPPPPSQNPPWSRSLSARKAGNAGAMELLAASQGMIACLPEAWSGVRAAAPAMDTKSRQAWFERLSATCGRRYPTFAYGVLAPMIAGIKNPGEQSEAWDWAFNEYRARADLAGDARIRQGRLWEKTGNKARAYEAYLDVARVFPNDGTLVVDALDAAEEMLREAGKDSAAADMYTEAWRRISRPSSTSVFAFASSNYYRVGERYAAALERAGRMNEAGNVRRMIERGVEKPGP